MSSTSSPPSSTTVSAKDEEYPPIKKGASLLIAYQLSNRPVLLIGGGVVASGRLFFLLESGAKVTLIAPSPLDPSISYRLKTNPEDIIHHDRPYLGRSDSIKVTEFVMVLTAIDDNNLSRSVCEMAREEHIPVNVADVPPECDFYFGAQFRRGPLQVMVSTQGQGPKIGAMVRDTLLDALPPNVEEAIAGVGALRRDLRIRAPGVGGPLGKERMDWMIGICNAWGLEDMELLKDEKVREMVLDQGWEKGRAVVKPRDVRRTWDMWGWLSTMGAGGGGEIGTGMRGMIGGVMLGAVGGMAWSRYSR